MLETASASRKPVPPWPDNPATAARRPWARLLTRSTSATTHHALLRDRSGAAAVEFAIVAVPFFGLLFAIFQTSLAFFMQQGLVSAVNSAARQVLVGNVQSNAGISTWQQFRDQLVCPAPPATSMLPSFMTCSNLVVDVRTAKSFSSTSASSTNDSFLFDGSGPQFQPGCQDEIVIVRAAYPMPAYLPILVTSGSGVARNTSGLTNYNGQLVQMLSAAAVFRNEPFGTQGTC